MSKGNHQDKPSYSAVEKYIQRMNEQYPTPLSQVVDLQQYTNKIYEKALICCEIKDDEIVSAVIGYIDNLISNMAFITLVGTVPEHRHRGYTEKLIGEFVEACKDRSISGIHLYTDKNNMPAINLYTRLGFVDYPDESNMNPRSRHLVHWIEKERR